MASAASERTAGVNSRQRLSRNRPGSSPFSAPMARTRRESHRSRFPARSACAAAAACRGIAQRKQARVTARISGVTAASTALFSAARASAARSSTSAGKVKFPSSRSEAAAIAGEASSSIVSSTCWPCGDSTFWFRSPDAKPSSNALRHHVPANPACRADA